MNTFMSIVMQLWLSFSNLFWRRKNNAIIPFYDYYDGKTPPVTWVRKKGTEMMTRFNYTYDKIENIITPPLAYKRAYDDVLNDDCDGFHALMFHILHQNYEELKLQDLALFCMIPLELKPMFSSHIVLAFKYEDIWYVLDYDVIYTWKCKTLNELMQQYWERYFHFVVKAKTDKHYCTPFEYDYISNKWKLVNINN